MNIELLAVQPGASLNVSGGVAGTAKQDEKKFDINIDAENFIITKKAVNEYTAIQSIDTNKEYIDDDYNDLDGEYITDARFSDAVIFSKGEIYEDIEALQYLNESQVRQRENLVLQMSILDTKTTDKDIIHIKHAPDDIQYSLNNNMRIDSSRISSSQRATIARMNLIKKASLSFFKPSPHATVKSNVIHHIQAKALQKKQILDKDDFEIFVGQYDYTLSVLDKEEKIQDLVA